MRRLTGARDLLAIWNQDQLDGFGFKRLGSNIRLSQQASVYGAANIEIGDNVRIDDFCVLSAGAGGIAIGCNVHIAVHSTLMGAARIELHDFSGLSSRVSTYSSTDDYSGEVLTNPTVDAQFTGVRSEPVTLGRHVIVGTGSVILPGVTMHEGSAAGAMSLIRRDCDAFGIYAGIPARRIAARSRRLLGLEEEFRKFRRTDGH